MSDKNFTEKLPAVELLKSTGEIQDAYCRAYEARYQFNPVMSDEDLRVIRWAHKTLGAKRAIDALHQYLKMDSEWFIKNVHSLRVFQTNVNQVMASVMGKRPNTPHRKLRITFKAACDFCIPRPQDHYWGEHVWITCWPDEVDTTERKCDYCKVANRTSPWLPTKEEREAIFARLQFKELPT